MKRTMYSVRIIIIALCVLLVSMLPVRAAQSQQSEYSELFDQYLHGGEAGSEGRIYQLCECFFDDPIAFIRALSLETEEVQKAVTESLPRSMYNGMHPMGYLYFPDVVYAIELAEDDTPETRYVLQCFEAAVVKYWDIKNPKTGDGLNLVAAILVFSLVGVALLVAPKKFGR